jgi:gliding motility-associated-like protein
VLLTADTLPKYTYQWRLNSSSISGANSRFLQVKAIGNYDVVVTDSNGCVRTSSVFNITSKPNPSTKIDTLGPVSVCIGGSIALRADTLAKARFQWFKNGTPLVSDTNRFISALSAGTYSYRVIDSNGCRSISSGTEVFFNTVPTAAASALGSTNFCLGGSTTLTANNAPGSTYQWRKNSLNILGENLQSFEATTSGAYSVRVCNGGCCVVSNTIVVNVDTPPTANISPNTTQNVCMGSTVTLNASTGTGYTYQWQVNGIPITGATSASFTATDSGFYTVNISFGYCTIAPPTVRVNMIPIPPVPFNVLNQVYCQGDTPTPLSASANLGNILKWYTTPTGGTGTTTAPTQSTLISDTFKFYVVQMNAFNCESPRVLQQVIVNPTPQKPIVNDIFYCNGDTAKALTSTLTSGDTLIWYNTRTGGVGSRIAPTPNLTTFGKQVFFVSQKTKFGCEGPRDSIIVTFSDTSSKLIRDTICKNQFVTFNNIQINSSGIYRDTFLNFKGCDSFVTLHLHVKDTSITIIFDTICINHPILFKGQLRTLSGLYLDTLTNKNGCDSFVFFNLIVNDTPSINLFDTICKNSFVFFKNKNINTSGIYRDTFISNKGCDSFVTLHLLVNDTSSTDIFDTICVNDPILFNNQVINVSGIYKDTIFNKFGCDSFIYLHLTVLDTFRTILWDTICANEIRIFGNQNLNKIGIYFDTIIAPNGCFDFITLNLFVKDTSRFIIFDTICKNQPILFNSLLINTTGVYKDTFVNSVGCDSFVYLNLIVNDTPSTQLFDTICHSSFILFNGQRINTSGAYRDTFNSRLNCDSFVTLNLFVIPKVFIDKVTICEKDNYLGYNKTGTYYDTFIENGCERVREIQLTVNPTTFGFITQEICYHDRIYGNIPIGIFLDTLMNANGCDSIVTKEVKVKNKPLTPLNDTFFCEGESVLLQAEEGFYLYTWNDGTTKTNLLVDKPGTYNFVIMDSFRCVDFDTINVNVLPKTEVKILPIASESYETEELFHVIAEVIINDSFDNGRYKWSSNTKLTCDTCNKTSFKLEDQNWIKVTYTNLYQCRSMDSIFFEVAPEPEYIADFPNAFSPNNDTRNDVFGPQTKNVNSIKWNIFNRWGELIYEAQSRTQTWDGTYKGIPQEVGMYIYTGEVEFKNGLKKQLKGEIYLIR